MFDNHSLTRCAPPSPVPDYADFASCKLLFEEAISFPLWVTEHVQSLEFTDEERDQYIELCDGEDTTGSHHRILGHPQEIQGEMPLECQLASNGVYCGNLAGYENPRAKDHAAGADQWRLLIQIDSDDNVGWMWGDVGRLYFWITESDLRARQFDNAWMILQCY